MAEIEPKQSILPEKKEVEWVSLWSRVTYQDKGEDEKYTTTIVPDEQRKYFRDIDTISNESPLGKALLNSKAGDEVEVECAESYKVDILEVDNSVGPL